VEQIDRNPFAPHRVSYADSGPEEHLDERQLIEQVRRGAPEAERAFYDAHVDRVYRLAYRMTGDETLAQDCTQETFVRAFAHLDGFRGDAKLSTWLHRIAMTVVLNGLRKIKRHRTREVEIDDQHQNIAGRDAAPGLRRRLQDAVDKLTEDARTVFVLHDVEGFKHQEIGSLLGIPIGTSKARLSRAREVLRDQLQPFSAEWK